MSRRPTLRTILKVLGVIALVVALLFGVASWALFQNKNELLIGEIQNFMNESQSGTLEVGTVDLKLFKSFPRITIELDSINYFEHRDTLRAPGEQPILHAEQLFVALEFLPLLKDQLKITEVTLANAELNIIEYADGNLNIDNALAPPVKARSVQPPDTAKKNTPTTQKPTAAKKSNAPSAPPPAPTLEVNLDFVSLEEVTLKWTSGQRAPAVILVHDLEADLVIDSGMVTSDLQSKSEIQSVRIANRRVPPGQLTLDGKIQYDLKSKTLSVRDGNIKYNEFSASVNGTYANQKERKVDLEIDASSNDLELLSLVIKPKVLRQNPDLLKTGDIYIKGKVTGALTSPQVDVSFGLRDLTLQLPGKLGAFNDVAFDGRFTSGSAANYSEATLAIRNVKGEVPGGSIGGSFRIHNFQEPHLTYNGSATLNIEGYDQIFDITAISQLRGSISVSASFDGQLSRIGEHESDSSRSSSVMLDSISFVLARTNKLVSGLSGTMENKNNRSRVKDLAFRYGENNLRLDATFENLAYWLVKGSADLSAAGRLTSSQLHTGDLLFDTTARAHVMDRVNDLTIDFEVKTSGKKDSSAMIPDISFSIKKLTAAFDKLPNINSVTATGTFRDSKEGLRLDLPEFHAIMPQGKLDVAGDLLVRNRRLWAFNAKLQSDKFPIVYVEELISEINSHSSGKHKETAAKLDLVTAELDLTAELQTFPFDLHQVVIRDSKFNVQFANSKSFSARKLNVNCKELLFEHPPNSSRVIGVRSTNGNASFTTLMIPGMNQMDLDLSVTGRNDSLTVNFSRGSESTRNEDGTLFIDISKKEPALKLDYVVQGAKLDYYLKKIQKKDVMKGEVDYKLDITSSGLTSAALKENVKGTVEINGDSLLLYGVDVDKVLRKFERSQKFNLTDLGAVLVAGPVGLAVTKGTDFVSLATVEIRPGHQTHIQTLHSKWKLEDLNIITEDVAFTTLENRIAFNGSINLANDSIPGLTIAVVDKEGCALMEQQLYGKMSALKTSELKIAKTLFGSVTNFVNTVVGKDCKPVYTGSVKPPL